MKNSEVKEMLIALHQAGMARAFEEQQANRIYDDLTRDEFVAKMCMAQIAENEERTLARLRKTAKLRFDAQPEDIIWDSERGLDKPSLRSLLSADWIRRTENVLITGPSGTGKTWLACALGNAVLRANVSVRYFRTNPLLQEMRRAHVDGSIARMRKSLATPKLVILDDFGIAPIDEPSKEDLFEILEARTDIGSTLIVGQLAPSEWYAYLDTRHLADAIMDRVVQRAHIIPLKGDSLRRRL